MLHLRGGLLVNIAKESLLHFFELGGAPLERLFRPLQFAAAALQLLLPRLGLRLLLLPDRLASRSRACVPSNLARAAASDKRRSDISARAASAAAHSASLGAGPPSLGLASSSVWAAALLPTRRVRGHVLEGPGYGWPGIAARD